MLSIKEIIFVVIFAGLIGFGASRYFNPVHNQPPSNFSHLGGNFTLPTKDAEISLSDFAGRNVILYFGFTHCPDVCPLSLQNLGSLYKKLPKHVKANTQVIFISVDYRRDTADSVQEYAKHFDSSFIGLTGEKELIEMITKKYGVFFEFEDMPKSALKYTVNHSSRFYLINPKGILINALMDTVKFDKFKKEVLRL